MGIIPWYVIVVRLLVPLFILQWPLGGILASMVADTNDWKFIQVKTHEDGVAYQALDKAMDLYSWLFILWILRSWKDVWARNVALGLFGYRLIGMVWFWLTGWREILFFFPNVFENFVVLSLLVSWVTKRKKLKLRASQKFLMIALLIVPKLIHEHFQHFLGKQPWEIYDVGRWLGLAGVAQEYTNLLVWGGMFYLIPILGFLFYIWRSGGEKSKRTKSVVHSSSGLKRLGSKRLLHAYATK